MYDREHEKIGFWKTNCSEVWERLHISDAPPQVPPPLGRKNSSIDIPPTMAPIGPPPYILPGELEVGRITFSISLDVKFSNLKYHMTKLAQFIAQELNVNASQVHLLNFSANGNNSVTRWAIFPAGSVGFMSNDVATSIVSRIAEHRVHLPETFGNYQFSEWKVEPPPKRSWWEQHNVSVVVAVIVFLVFGLSGYGTWFVWKRRQQSLIGYKPVDAITPEQELQPL